MLGFFLKVFYPTVLYLDEFSKQSRVVGTQRV